MQKCYTCRALLHGLTLDGEEVVVMLDENLSFFEHFGIFILKIKSAAMIRFFLHRCKRRAHFFCAKTCIYAKKAVILQRKISITHEKSLFYSDDSRLGGRDAGERVGVLRERRTIHDGRGAGWRIQDGMQRSGRGV